MFKLPQGNKTNAEGTSADKPIKLPADIKSKDFKGILKLLYPLKCVISFSVSLAQESTSKVFMSDLLSIQQIRRRV